MVIASLDEAVLTFPLVKAGLTEAVLTLVRAGLVEVVLTYFGESWFGWGLLENPPWSLASKTAFSTCWLASVRAI